jgi:Flp pilus assembly protein CpaB
LREQRYLALALAAGLVTAFATYTFLGSLQDRVPVVVAARDLPEFSQLEPDMVRTILVHPSAVHPSSVRREEDAMGQRLGTLTLANEPILKDKLLVLAGDGVAGRLKPDERALFLPVGLAGGVGGALEVRDRVDVILVADEAKLGYAEARTIARNVLVLEILADSGRPWSREGRDEMLGVLVAVTPGQAEALALAMASGRIYLAANPYEPDEISRGEMNGDAEAPKR